MYKVSLTMIAIVIFCCLAAAPPAGAWHTLMHPMIARNAFQMLPETMKQPLQEHLSTIEWASMVPDLMLADAENHDWNVHEKTGRQGGGVEKVLECMYSLEALLSNKPSDWVAIAYEMGLLSHYLSDLNQPLHTDEYDPEEAWIHQQYENDVWDHLSEIPLEVNGAVLRIDAFSSIFQDIGQANHYYRAILDAYETRRGFPDALGLTAINVQRSVQAVSDAWRTAWAKTVSSGPSVSLKMNHASLGPGDTVRLSLSIFQGKQTNISADIYLAFFRDSGELWFLRPDGKMGLEPVPAVSSWPVTNIGEAELMSLLISPDVPFGGYGWFMILVSPAKDLMDTRNWLGDPAILSFTVQQLPEIRLTELGNEGYLFSAQRPVMDGNSQFLLRQWDFLFFGDQQDDPETPEDESATDALIPGVFNHMFVYMGRDKWGAAYGVELTESLSFEGQFLRIVKLPEFERPASGSENIRLPIVTKDIERYSARWALRLTPEHIGKIAVAGSMVLQQIETDIRDGFPYQLEFKWSGDLKDKQIFLVDDGRDGGATCTDYWLSTLEMYADICIHGSRITAAELEDYFLYDPEGSKATIPDVLNPFPFPITVKALLGLGFYPVDPSPHLFSCDGSEETGLPIPDRLVEQSPDLIAIDAEDIQ